MAALFFGEWQCAFAIFVASAARNVVTLRGAPGAGPHLTSILCSLGIALGNVPEAMVAAWMLENRAGSSSA